MRYRGYELTVEMILEPYFYFLGMVEGYEVMGSTKAETIGLLKEYIDNLLGRI